MIKLRKHVVQIISILVFKYVDHATRVANHVLEINQIIAEHVFHIWR